MFLAACACSGDESKMRHVPEKLRRRRENGICFQRTALSLQFVRWGRSAFPTLCSCPLGVQPPQAGARLQEELSKGSHVDDQTPQQGLSGSYRKDPADAATCCRAAPGSPGVGKMLLVGCSNGPSLGMLRSSGRFSARSSSPSMGAACSPRARVMFGVGLRGSPA